jgi:hypothetical protein
MHAAKAKALWKSATEKQHFEEALSQAIEVTQNASPGNCRQGSSNLEILEVKRSQLKRQVQNELSLRDKALESHASIVESFYIGALRVIGCSMYPPLCCCGFLTSLSTKHLNAMPRRLSKPANKCTN